jgi:hypothetical protein
VAENVPATLFAVLAPPIPFATATLAATSAATATATRINLRIVVLPFSCLR